MAASPPPVPLHPWGFALTMTFPWPSWPNLLLGTPPAWTTSASLSQPVGSCLGPEAHSQGSSSAWLPPVSRPPSPSGALHLWKPLSSTPNIHPGYLQLSPPLCPPHPRGRPSACPDPASSCLADSANFSKRYTVPSPARSEPLPNVIVGWGVLCPETQRDFCHSPHWVPFTMVGDSPRESALCNQTGL